MQNERRDCEDVKTKPFLTPVVAQFMDERGDHCQGNGRFGTKYPADGTILAKKPGVSTQFAVMECRSQR
jgi:hypothetical protein